MASESFKTVQMAAKLPPAERGMWGAEPPQMINYESLKYTYENL